MLIGNDWHCPAKYMYNVKVKKKKKKIEEIGQKIVWKLSLKWVFISKILERTDYIEWDDDYEMKI